MIIVSFFDAIFLPYVALIFSNKSRSVAIDDINDGILPSTFNRAPRIKYFEIIDEIEKRVWSEK